MAVLHRANYTCRVEVLQVAAGREPVEVHSPVTAPAPVVEMPRPVQADLGVTQMPHRVAPGVLVGPVADCIQAPGTLEALGLWVDTQGRQAGCVVRRCMDRDIGHTFESLEPLGLAKTLCASCRRPAQRPEHATKDSSFRPS